MSRPRGRPATPTSALVPAAARRDGAGVAVVDAVLHQEAIEVFAKAVGGRDRLADTLAVAGSGSDIERITTLLLDPRYRAWSLARLCQTVGLTVADLFAAYRKANIARAHIESSHIIAGKLPAVVTDVMDKALPRPVLCGLCDGRRTIDDVPCGLCAGTGIVQSEPTVERHKLALEVGQLLEKKGGLIVQQNNMAAMSANAPGALEQLQQAVGDLLFSGGRGQEGAEGLDGIERREEGPVAPDAPIRRRPTRPTEPDDDDLDLDDLDDRDDDDMEEPDDPPRR